MSNILLNNKLIAKNTLLLYVRTILVMLVALYTSRVVLNTLGVKDYGIYQVVGGFVGMFSVISGALSTAISRFLTFGLGKGDVFQLKKIFSTSVIVQILISILILLLCEVVGLWMLHGKLNIPEDRMVAATYVLHCSLASFVINLLSVPYNASIISHEKMDVFAYISILEVFLKLGIVLLLKVSSFDKLVTYAILIVIVSLLIRVIYSIYCGYKFEECRGKLTYDGAIFKEMVSFAGWNFLSNAVYIFNTQGITMLVNMYFGVAMNAARGLATQVEGAVQQFTNNFTTAINPQITKSYATGDLDRMSFLVCKGSKFSFFLLFIFALPIMAETNEILRIWLVNVPGYTTLFTRLAFISAMVAVLGNSCYTACLATGKIKKYTLVVSLISVFVFFLTWIIYELGGPVETSYYVYTIIWFILLIAKLLLTKKLTGFHPNIFMQQVILKIIPVILLSIPIPVIICHFVNPSIMRLIMNICITFLTCCINTYFVGLTRGEKDMLNSKVADIINKHKRLKRE